MNDSLRVAELVSDLMDARLSEQAFAEAVGEVALTGHAREKWNTYHLMGDLLRSGKPMTLSDDAGFLSRFQQRLQAETAVPLAPANGFRSLLTGAEGAIVAPTVAQGSRAANDAHFLWKWVGGLASLAVVGIVGWNVAGDILAPSSERQLAQVQPAAPTTVLVETSDDGQVMIRDPRLDRLLMAHRQSGGQSALQVPSGFLRSATFEVSNRQDLPN